MWNTLRSAILLYRSHTAKKGEKVGENLNTWRLQYSETKSVRLALMIFIAYQLNVVHQKPRGSVKQI